MTFFKVMDGTFGIDGLESSYPVTEAFATVDDAYRFILNHAETAPIATRCDAIGWWVEEHTDAEKDTVVWLDEPYPHKSMPEAPAWFRTKMSEIDFPKHEEVMEAIRTYWTNRTSVVVPKMIKEPAIHWERPDWGKAACALVTKRKSKRKTDPDKAKVTCQKCRQTVAFKQAKP